MTPTLQEIMKNKLNDKMFLTESILNIVKKYGHEYVVFIMKHLTEYNFI